MTSKGTDVHTYIADVPLERRATIEKLRKICQKNLKGYEECIAHGMPAYKRNGVLEVAFASQKQYIALYVMKKDVVDEFRGALHRVMALASAAPEESHPVKSRKHDQEPWQHAGDDRDGL